MAFAGPLRGAIIAPTATLSGAALEEVAAHLRRAIESTGAASASVALALQSAGAFVTGFVACRRAGAPAVLVSDRRPRPESFDAEQVLVRLNDCAATLLLADSAHAGFAKAAGFRLIDQCREDVALWRRNVGGSSEPSPSHVLLVYTSGTLSTPKAVMLSARALEWIGATNERLYAWQPGDRFLGMLPLTHLAGLANTICALQAGVDVVLAPSIAFARRVADTVHAHRVTVAGLVPFQLDRLFEVGERAALRSLRLVVCSAAPLHATTVAKVSEANRQLQIYNAYGLTEAFRCFAHPVAPERYVDGLIGHRLPGVEVCLRDPATGTPTPQGETGELCVRAPQVMSGYWKRSSSGTKSSDGWLRTGDLARAGANGEIYLTGRLKHLINGGGEKMTVESIEAVIAELGECQVAVHGENDGAGAETVTALVPASCRFELAELRQKCARRLPTAFWPTRLIEVARLPRTSTGKLDRRAIAELVRETQQ